LGGAIASTPIDVVRVSILLTNNEKFRIFCNESNDLFCIQVRLMNQRRLKSGVRFGFGMSSDFTLHKSRLYRGTLDCFVQVTWASWAYLFIKWMLFKLFLNFSDRPTRRHHGSLSWFHSNLVAYGPVERDFFYYVRTAKEALLITMWSSSQQKTILNCFPDVPHPDRRIRIYQYISSYS
jgi:hypothetical protein